MVHPRSKNIQPKNRQAGPGNNPTGRQKNFKKTGKLKGEESNIHMAVGQHKWKALRSLKKARIEAGTYIQDRLKVEEKAKVDLFKVASKKTEKARVAKVEEEEAKAEEIVQTKEDLEKKQQQRGRYTKKLTKRTKRGQPVMKHQIGYLLHKLKHDGKDDGTGMDS